MVIVVDYRVWKDRMRTYQREQAMPETLGDLTSEEFDQLIDQHIERSAQWDGALPLNTMLET